MMGAIHFARLKKFVPELTKKSGIRLAQIHLIRNT